MEKNAFEFSGLFRFENQHVKERGETFMLDIDIFLNAKNEQTYKMLREVEKKKHITDYAGIKEHLTG